MPLQPHMVCYGGNRLLVWGFAISDFFIWLAYMLISTAVAFLAKRLVFSQRWLLWGFFAFINLCGWTHLLHAVGIFKPNFVLGLSVDIATAAVSLVVAVVVCVSLPQLLHVFDLLKRQEIKTEEAYRDIEQMHVLSSALVDSTVKRIENMKSHHREKEEA